MLSTGKRILLTSGGMAAGANMLFIMNAAGMYVECVPERTFVHCCRRIVSIRSATPSIECDASERIHCTTATASKSIENVNCFSFSLRSKLASFDSRNVHNDTHTCNYPFAVRKLCLTKLNENGAEPNDAHIQPLTIQTVIDTTITKCVLVCVRAWTVHRNHAHMKYTYQSRRAIALQMAY